MKRAKKTRKKQPTFDSQTLRKQVPSRKKAVHVPSVAYYFDFRSLSLYFHFDGKICGNFFFLFSRIAKFQHVFLPGQTDTHKRNVGKRQTSHAQMPLLFCERYNLNMNEDIRQFSKKKKKKWQRAKRFFEKKREKDEKRTCSPFKCFRLRMPSIKSSL